MLKKEQPISFDWNKPSNAADSSYTNKSNTATPSTHSPVTSKYESGDILTSDEHDTESPGVSGSLYATCIQLRRSPPVVNVLKILTLTDTSGVKVKMLSVSAGSGRVNSCFDSMTPLVYSTQNGSKVVGEALGDADG